MNLNMGELFNTSQVIYTEKRMPKDCLPKRDSNRDDTYILQMFICILNVELQRQRSWCISLKMWKWKKTKFWTLVSLDLFIDPSVHLHISIHLPILHPSIILLSSIHLPTQQYTHPSNPPTHPSITTHKYNIHPSTHPCIYPVYPLSLLSTIHMYIIHTSIHPFFYPSVDLTLNLSITPSVHIFTYPSTILPIESRPH